MEIQRRMFHNLFLYSITDGRIDSIYDLGDALQEHGIDINTLERYERGRSVLMLAAEHPDSDMVKALCKLGADVNAVDDEHCTALLYASAAGSTACVIELCKQPGINPNITRTGEEHLGESPLMYACWKCKPAAVKALLDCGADPNAARQTDDEFTPLMYAINNRHGPRAARSIVELLLAAGADPEAVDSDDQTVFNHHRWEEVRTAGPGRNLPTKALYQVRKQALAAGKTRKNALQREINLMPPYGKNFVALQAKYRNHPAFAQEVLEPTSLSGLEDLVEIAQEGGRAPEESYIYFVGYGGLSDVLSEFVTCTKYAIKHKRSLLVEMGNVYTATDIKSVFDFSRYPVPVYTDKDMIHKLLTQHKVEPPIDLKKYLVKEGKIVKHTIPKNNALVFNTEKEYPRDTILIRAGGRKGRSGHELYFFQHVRLNEKILEQYKEFIKKHKIPSTYVAAHLRATDKPLSFTFNIAGVNKPTSNGIKHEGVGAFIEKYAPTPTYIATDNKGILEELKKKHPSVIHSDVVYKSKRNNTTTRKNGLHRNGKDDPQVFIDAILELIVLAKAKILMPSVGGYTEMAKDLWEHKDVVEHLLRN